MPRGISTLKSHMTYPAAECVHCHKIAIRICISHVDCEFGHHLTDCKAHF